MLTRIEIKPRTLADYRACVRLYAVPRIGHLMHASSFGVGEVIRAALDQGCHTVVLGVSGSASTDGGAGMLAALGARLFDAAGNDLPWVAGR